MDSEVQYLLQAMQHMNQYGMQVLNSCLLLENLLMHAFNHWRQFCSNCIPEMTLSFACKHNFSCVGLIPANSLQCDELNLAAMGNSN